MIPFDKTQQNKDIKTTVRIIGLGGAGSNMIDRVALDGMKGVELLTINTDVRTLSTAVGSEKIQLGQNLTKGLGTGGDPDLGRQAAEESEDEIRAKIKGQQIVFLCAGLGGGTGSGAAPLVARIAREEGAFLVTFVTMPFPFEGARRRDQASTSLNELAALSNALVTFDNARMGELVLAKDGIHEAFAAGDRLISNSIKSITRLVVQPGLVNIGLDELITALDTTRSRCLFGSGTASGENRSQKALKEALTSPLLDKGSLLEDAEKVLVHICGGEDLTLFEVNLLMEELTKHTPKDAHILFGSAVDPTMKDKLSVTIISALPEDLVQPDSRKAAKEEKKNSAPPVTQPEPAVEEAPEIEEEPIAQEPEVAEAEPEVVEEVAETPQEDPTPEPVEEEETEEAEPAIEEAPTPEAAEEEEAEEATPQAEEVVAAPNPFESADPVEPVEPAHAEEAEEEVEEDEEPSPASQGSLQLEGGPKGRFKGGDPNLDTEGSDLDVPAFLRKSRQKKQRGKKR